MAYGATVIPVMIASPGDVADERDIAREVIHDWNDVNSQRSQVMLAAVGWDTHSSPELGARPQELINKRILNDCDLLIGIFWTRLGTPTGKAQSGTVEEIEEHVAAGKPAMIYFSLKPVSLESVELEQYTKVKEIRNIWQQEQRGLVETYYNVDEFRRKLAKQLQVCLNKNEYLAKLLDRGATATPIYKVSGAPSSIEPLHLTADATALLKAAASDDQGTILKREYIGGQSIHAGAQTFGDSSRREFVRWEAALDQLIDQSLVADRGYQGDIFELTHEGWAVADRL